MRYPVPVKSAGLGILALAMTGAAATAQEAKAALPDVTTCPESIAAIATCYSAKQETGAYLLAAMPKNWNGNLIVFAHGGPDTAPPTATRSQADLDKYAVAVKRGFAWIATTYQREGYGIAMAVEDSDNARKFFIARIAKPQRTILHGASYGGLVGAKLVETRTYLFNSKISLPRANNATLAIPINNPCSTTPGISLSLRANPAGSGICPKRQSRM